MELRREMDPNVNANDSFHSLTSLLVSADPKLAVCVTKFLRLADFKRLCCTSRSIHHTLSRAAAAVVANKEDSTDSDLRATVAWLADLEILYALGCSSETTLVRKISEAILDAPARCRVTMYCPAGGPPGDDGTIFPTMTEAFIEFNSLVCTEDGCEKLSFRDAHEFDLEHQNLQSERDYCFVGGDGDKDNDEEEKLQRNELVRLGLDSDGSDDEDAPESSSKRQRTNRNGCDSQFCADGTNCKIPKRRMYYVQTSQYCGACIDSDIYLFLRFCSEHRVGGDYRNNTCWDIQEAEYVNDETKVNHPNKNLQLLPVLQQKKKDEAKEAKEWLQLKNDEFWVTIWKTDPLHSCELRLIGVGPRY